MPVAFSELLLAFEFISSDPTFGNSARVNRETGTVHWHSDWDSGLYELPEDIEDDQKYLELPGPRDLDLGKPLVMRFAADDWTITTTRSPTSSPARAPIAASRISLSGSAPSIAGTPTRAKRRKRRCVNGARTTGSRSTGRRSLSFPRTRESRVARVRWSVALNLREPGHDGMEGRPLCPARRLSSGGRPKC